MAREPLVLLGEPRGVPLTGWRGFVAGTLLGFLLLLAAAAGPRVFFLAVVSVVLALAAARRLWMIVGVLLALTLTYALAIAVVAHTFAPGQD
jgi:hypothetical protein